MKMTTGEKVFDLFNIIFMILMAFIFIYPFWYVLIISFNEGMDAVNGGIYFWPRLFTLENYKLLFKNADIVNSYKITVLRTIVGTLGTMFITTLVAFGLSRKELPGRNILVLVIFFTMLFGGGLIPYYLILQNIGLLNHFAVYIIPSLFSVFTMVVMNTSFKSIPDSLLESAQMDGANYFTIFIRIIIPLSMPMLAALSLFTAVSHWNDWFAGAYFNTDQKLQPLQTYLMTLLNAQSMLQNITELEGNASAEAMKIMTVTPRSLRMAALIITVAPILSIYPFLQRYFVKGVLIGSVKE